MESLALDGNGNVIMTGYTSHHPVDYYTSKYAATDGSLLWERRYDGPAKLGDIAHAVAVDGSGNVVITGQSASRATPGSGNVHDIYTATYASADGAMLWEKRYNGPINGPDHANAVAVDGNGNVVVTGSSATSGSIDRGFNYDYYTAKYAAGDGTLLWEKRYNGPALDDIAVVRVDGNGNVVVTGRSASRRLVSGGFINDYYTAKYAAADGALLWEKRYNGPANRDDYPSSLALGPNGMVVVTGSSSGTGSSHPYAYAGYDYATVVYREGLPPLSIERFPAGVRLRFTGIPGRSYIIERAASAISGPWNTINTQTAPASGLIEYLDANPPTGAAFYRTREP